MNLPRTALLTIVVSLGCGERKPIEQLQPADPLYDDPAFTKLGPPPRGGWRTRVNEPGQSFADYEASNPNRPTAQRRTLVLVPVGEFPSKPILPDDLPSVSLEEDGFVTYVFAPAPEQLAEFLTAFYGLPTRVEPRRPLELEPIRIHNHHAQFDARALLAALEPTLPDNAYSLTALLARDLVVDEQEFAFGYGLHVDRLAVLSFAQLDPQFSGQPRSDEFQMRIRERGYKLVAHEVGHTLGLGHCDEYACVMNGVAHLPELDASPLRLCPVCLRKLLWLVEIDPLERYRELARVYEARGLEAELAWVRGRIERLGE